MDQNEYSQVQHLASVGKKLDEIAIRFAAAMTSDQKASAPVRYSAIAGNDYDFRATAHHTALMVKCEHGFKLEGGSRQLSWPVGVNYLGR